jgi:hypothetical protein
LRSEKQPLVTGHTVSKEVGPVIVDKRPMWMRPVSSTIGRLDAPLKSIIMGSESFLKRGPNKYDPAVQHLAETFSAANTDDRLEVQLGSSMPMRNLTRIWQRRGLDSLGKLLGTLFWPEFEIGRALCRSDCYDPFAHSVILYHNDPAIFAHELGHAEDFAKRKFRLLYIIARYSWIVTLYQEWIASRNGIRHMQRCGLDSWILRANRVMGGGFGTYVGALIFGVGALVGGPIGQLIGLIWKPFGGLAAAEIQPSEQISKDARQWAMFCHLAGLAGLLIPVIGNIVAPLIIWQIKKEEHPFVDEQGKEALNFQITVLIACLAAGLLTFVCIGFLLLPAVGIVDLIFCIMACVKVNNGEHYRYPLTIRFIK